jgi:A/G-specific adenine glycosylase
VKGVRRALLAWYRRHGRDLPWRRSRDPYAIWVSEIMLQQTRVETVIPYYERFMGSFPDVQALAAADTDEVLRHWAGLGYYRRARHLQAAARQVAGERGGEIPSDPAELRRLAGVGRYTAGAIASIAFDRPEPVLDGNVTRVLARLLELREDLSGATACERLWKEAAALARGPQPGALNQALMELGATLCTPRAPRCEACPVATACGARAAGDPEALPAKRRRAPPRSLRAACALLMRRGRALAVRRPPEGLLGGLWELPGGELAAGEQSETGLVRALRERVGLLAAGHVERIGTVRHVFTHRVLELHVFRAEARGRVRLAGFDAHRWVVPRGLGGLPASALAHKALALLEVGPAPGA